MPCSCEGYPPSPCYGDLIGCAEDAMKKIKQMEEALRDSEERNHALERELSTLKEAFKIVGNGG